MKVVIKPIFFAITAILISPVTFCYFALAQIANRDELISSFSQLLSLLPGKISCYLRSGFYRFTLTSCSPDAIICFGTLLSQRDTEIGSGAYIGPQCNIGRSSIGKNTLLGSGVHIMSGKGQHKFDDLSTPIREQGGSFEKVSIGENCWLGNGTLVMANIGNNCIVGAGSVVTKALPANSIAHGNPCHVVQYRRNEHG
ncbi:acyltransferase [Neiella marina]|uniref:Acyltransferase n=1 Tax=Neiella holothuriorum TaxID=2870530 RepID=A0ABS7EHD4_9GAMM|nr:acyltransferase [Neiella holothuriorum]MBW8191639.1 acyltransferase [Neiella holothuriorum]